MFLLMLLVALTGLCTQVVAQSLISGDIAGVITDPTGAVIPGATVTLKSLDTGSGQTVKANQAGAYRFTLLRPGRYTVAASQAGFQTVERPVAVSVGQTVTANIAMEVGKATQTVVVEEAAPLLNPDPSMNTGFTPAEMRALPSPGGDMTNIALTVPGVVVNSVMSPSTGGYGNFFINGMPGTSNLFTVNGENFMDPYFNINNTGATNLSLGQNELQEATVISNAYGGQYGQLAGSQIVYVTRGGTNEFHGNLQYWWNGRVMNANDWFSNSEGIDRPFSNANQWAGAVGGPIRKNKTFFFVNNEGLRFVLPSVTSTTIPTQAFSNAVLANIKNVQPNEYSAYQKLFNLYASAPGASAATPLDNSSYCNSLVLPGFNPATQNCAARYNAAPSGLASEWILTARVDQKIGDNDNAFFRYKMDHGLQPTLLDPINSNFDAISSQPSWDMQFHETHVFGARSTNDFLASLSHYTAQFAQNHDLAAQTFPYGIITSGAVPFTTFNYIFDFPQGRNITQYQFTDDFTVIRGSHNFKFGGNFRRYDVSDHNFTFDSPAVYFGYTSNGLQNFANGLAYQYRQTLHTSNDVPVAMWGLGLYAQDEWNVTSRLKLTFALRAERNSNPVCQTNCFANFTGAWSTIASVNSSNPGSVPYSSDILYNQHQAFAGVDAVDWSPRFGFSWAPTHDSKTVVSGGFGIFYDSASAGLVDDELTNPPVSVQIRVRPAAGVLPFDPAGGAATWQASANAFSMSKTYTQIATAMSALGSSFSAPTFTALVGTMHAPRWEEWNFQVQRQLTNSVAVTLNYIGNHGGLLPYTNNWPNAYDLYQIFPGVKGVPANVPVPNYGQVSTVQSGAISNYQGLSITLKKQFSRWVSAHVNYVWSHNLDDVSNGGVWTTGDSLLGQISPTALAATNYGNSDYDIRHNFNADFVFNPTFDVSSRFAKHVVNGWQLAGKWFWRSGLPFSVIDGNWNGALGNGGGTILAQPIGSTSAQTGNCGEASVNTPCLNANAFLNSGASSFNGYSQWPTQSRNQYRASNYFDVDITLAKTFKLQEKVNLGVGIQAFNVLNHPNFGIPDNGLGDSTFGQVTGMAGTPTSPYGNFLGFDSSPRIIQLMAKFSF